MKKRLPINKNVEVYSECWTHMRLSFILTKAECYPWYCQNFNNYYMEDKFYSVEFDNAFTSSYFAIYKDILNDKKILVNNEFNYNIINSLNDNGYIIVFCNYGVLFPENKDGINHEVLIFGYDSEDKTYSIYLHFNNVWTEKIVEQQLLLESVKIAIKTQDEYYLRSVRFELPCTAYFFKSDINININLRAIYLQIVKYLEGNIYENMNVQTYHKSESNKLLFPYKIYFGISTYDAYYNSLYQNIIKNN